MSLRKRNPNAIVCERLSDTSGVEISLSVLKVSLVQKSIDAGVVTADIMLETEKSL
jgi:hypothetical protein